MDSMNFIYCVGHTFHHESWSHIWMRCGLTWNMLSKCFLQATLTLCKICGMYFGVFVSTCPIFLHTKPNVNNLCIPFFERSYPTKLHFIKVVFTIIISTLTKADPFFLCRIKLSTSSEDKEKHTQEEWGVVDIQLFVMHIHIICVMH